MVSDTPATQNERGCLQVPRLPRKVPRRHRRPIWSKRATRPSPVSAAPRLPRKTKVHVSKRHACQAKRRWMSPSATPAMQNEGGCRQAPHLPRKVPRRHLRPIRSKRATRPSPVVCERCCVKKMMCDEVVCVTKVCVKDGCVTDDV